MYQAQREREQLQQTIPSREDFLRSLQQEAEVEPVSKSTLARVAQLTNKTNQFNLTTRRRSEQEIAELCTSPAWNCFSLRVYDRFGDNGLVGVAITHRQEDCCEIDTFLLSCRVIGRSVEAAFLSFLACDARERGRSRLSGWFHPTKKNQPARDFYPTHGFAMDIQEGDAIRWVLDISKNIPLCPDWIHLRILTGEEK